MSLTIDQYRSLYGEILRIFPTFPDLAIFTRLALNENLVAISGEGSLNTVVFNLINWVEANDKTFDFVQSGQQTRPGSLILRTLMIQLSYEMPTPGNSFPVMDSRPPLFSSIRTVRPNLKMAGVGIQDGKDFYLSGQQIVIEHGARRGSTTLKFDITNPNYLEMRLGDVFVDVLHFQRVKVTRIDPPDPGMAPGGIFGAGANFQHYDCIIKSDLSSYSCKRLSDKYDYVKLSKGELECIVVYVYILDVGIYDLGVTIEYFLGGQAHKARIGTVTEVGAF